MQKKNVVHFSRTLLDQLGDWQFNSNRAFYTVRPRDTRPQAARTLTMHVFELGPKKFEMHKFLTFFPKIFLDARFFINCYLRCTNFWFYPIAYLSLFLYLHNGVKAFWRSIIIFKRFSLKNIYINIITKLSWKKVHAKNENRLMIVTWI